VWLIRKRVRPNLHPSTFRAVGVLTVSEGKLRFISHAARAQLHWPRSANAHIDLLMERVRAVEVKRYGWGLAPPFVAITYGPTADVRTAYFSDGGWRGWRPMLIGSNRQIAQEIREAVDSASSDSEHR
jgi:hypothetical protein